MSFQDKLKPVSTTTPSTGGFQAKLKPVGTVTPSVTEKKDGFFKSIAKDVAETLVVKPVARATEAATRVFAPNSLAAKGYEAAYDAGESLKVLGIEVDPQKAFGQGGAKQIVGDALKTTSWLYGGGGAVNVGKATLAGKIGRGFVQGAKAGAIGGGAYSAGEALQETDASFGDVAKAGAIGGTIGGVTGGVLGGTLPAVVAGVKSFKPETIMNRVARVNPLDATKFQKSANKSIGKYLIERGIYGNDEEIVTQLADRFTRSKNVADDSLAKLGGTWKTEPVTTALDDLVARESRISTKGAPSKDLARVTTLATKSKSQGLTMSEVNEVKRLFERNVKLDYLRQNVPESIARANTIDDAIRSWQFSQAEKLGLKNLKEINKETQLAKQLGDALIKKNRSQQGNNAFGLTDAILISGGDPQAIAMLLTKKTFGSKGVQSAIAKRLAGKPTVGQPQASMRGAVTDTTRMLPEGTPSVEPNVINVPPSTSAVSPEDIARNNAYFAEQARRNTLALPEGRNLGVQGETIKLKAPASMEKGVPPSPQYFGTQKMLPERAGAIELPATVGSSKQVLQQLKPKPKLKALPKTTPKPNSKSTGKLGKLDGKPLPKSVVGTKTTDITAQASKMKADGKYKTTLNLQDKNDLEELGRIFSRDAIDDMKNGKMVNWRGTSYEETGRVNIINEKPMSIAEKLEGKIKEKKMSTNTFYHGTSADSARSIMQSGFKTGASLPENAFRGGGYGRMQNSISLAETPKVASIFSNLSRNGEIVEVKLKDNAKVVSIDGIEDAIDLEDFIPYLKKQKIDAVYIGGGEKELVVLNPKSLTPTRTQLEEIWNKANKK